MGVMYCDCNHYTIISGYKFKIHDLAGINFIISSSNTYQAIIFRLPTVSRNDETSQEVGLYFSRLAVLNYSS